MVSDRDSLLMSAEEFEAHREMEKREVREKKTQIRIAIKSRKETISKIKKAKRGLSRAFGNIAKGLRGRRRIAKGLRGGRRKGRKSKKKAVLRRRIRVIEVKIRMKKKSKIVGIFEKQQEEKSLFFKN